MLLNPTQDSCQKFDPTLPNPVQPMDRPNPYQLRASSSGGFVVLRTRRRIGDRAFSVAAPRAWNRLQELKLLRSTINFRHQLKTFLFQSAYGHREHADWWLFVMRLRSPSMERYTNDPVTDSWTMHWTDNATWRIRLNYPAAMQPYAKLLLIKCYFRLCTRQQARLSIQREFWWHEMGDRR